ncbi:MBL fold metallo-hydrolase [Arsenicicoccus piscis]|uniref:MBL fold hydrolase n=1 Tax=Arsenicicoccus piscis TaxID=673954 RepID=A0ABQ6HV87_9MICO|nr:MBL fold metallo-hydrolase [Arsenicicoccus piscis]MCH8627323.1 MBL fold metallo-hydrolase [Arsenicicoccus piscis]GMA21465.1 MBL fold hydrolase [Arsenicicoccus piscis]
MSTLLTQVGDDLFHGAGTASSWFVVRDGRDLTLVDSGYPGDYPRLQASIESIGHQLGDVRGVLLTHGHIDHFGGVNRLWREHRVPTYLHRLELLNAKAATRQQASPRDVLVRAWRPRVASWAVRIIRAGALQKDDLEHVVPFDDTTPLDLPGRPVPVLSPGHTSGHTGYSFPDRGALATGDAVVTGHPLEDRTGPHLIPDFFTHDLPGARRSLDVLAAVVAETLLPGHGPVWRGPWA